MASKKVGTLSGAAAGAALLIALSACGDSTGTGSVDSEGALQSLRLGIADQSAALASSPFGAGLGSSLTGVAALLGHVNVTIGNDTQQMFALGVRQTFPAGTCEETLFIAPGFPPPVGQCTYPEFGLALVLWQTRSANRPPDRLLVISAPLGDANFDFSSIFTVGSTATVPGFALYLEGKDKAWVSSSGTLQSTLGTSGPGCNVPLPPYAKAATCKVVLAHEVGSIQLEDLESFATNPPTLGISIPAADIPTILQEITQTQPITFTGR
jgi:hypothetical protein